MKATINDNRNRNAKKIYGSLFLIFIMVFMTIPQLYQSGDSVVNDNQNTEIERPIASGDSWWNQSFLYRRSISVTNPFGKDVDDVIVSIVFNYTTYVERGVMNESLKDVRITDNNVLVPYFVKKDYPVTDLSTVYFNISLLLGEDTTTRLSMYYGNDSVEQDAEFFNKDNRFGNHWWTLDGDYEDSIGGITGVPDNVGVVPGVYGSAVNFPSTTGNLKMYEFSIGSTLSVSGWVRGGQSGTMPWGMRSNAGNLDPYYTGVTICNNIGDGAQNPYKILGTETNYPFPVDGQWYYLTWENVDYSNGTLTSKLWINGTLKATAIYRNPTTTLRIFQLSGWPYNNQYKWTGAVDDVRVFNYGMKSEDIKTLMNPNLFDSSLGDEEAFSANIEITIHDIDGRLVPNAAVSLINASDFENPVVVETCNTNSFGIARFIGKNAGLYNVSVEYSTKVRTYLAYNSSEVNYNTANWNMYNFSNYINNLVIEVNCWSIDIFVEDIDANPMGLGFILVYEDFERTNLWDNVSLDRAACYGTFRGPQLATYYYDVYYDNDDYYQPITKVSSGSKVRSDYVKTESINVYEKNMYNQLWNYYQIEEVVYVTGTNSTDRGVSRAISVSIEMTNMEDLATVYVDYIDINGTSVPIASLGKTYPGSNDDADTINFNFMDNGLDAYGVNVYVRGNNDTTCNGVIEVTLNQASVVESTANLAKANIHVVDGDGIVGAVVKVWTGNTHTGQSIVNLTTASGEVFGERGYAYGTKNLVPLWFTPGQTYNLSLRFGTNDNMDFLINATNPDMPADETTPTSQFFSFLLTNERTIMLTLADTSKYRAEFFNYTSSGDVVWGEMMTYSINLTTTMNDGESYAAAVDAEYVNFSVYIWGVQPVLVLNQQFTHIGEGIYEVSLNSSLLSAGTSGFSYVIKVRGKVTGFPDPGEITDVLRVNARQTTVLLHNSSDLAETLPDFTVSEYYNEDIDITLSLNYGGSRLSGASLDYSWTYGNRQNIAEDSENPGYYTFSFNTGDSPNVGKYSINVLITKENYTLGFQTLFINILSRPTSLSESSTNVVDETEIVRISLELNKTDTHKFYFSYKEVMGAQAVINDTNIADYSWEYITDGTKGFGDLVLMENNTFELDFDTANKDVGSYILLVTIGKSNFDMRQSIIFLTIKNRTANIVMASDFAGQNRIEKISGNTFNMRIELTDGATGNAITNAKVSIILESLGRTIEFRQTSDGVYEATESFEDVKAFFNNAQIAGKLVIEIEHYDVVERDISLVVKMDEIFEGVPTFYFLIGVLALVLIASTLVINKVVQKSRIPPLVRQMMALRKTITSGGAVQRGNLVETYEETIENDLEKDLQAIGLKLNKQTRKEEGI